MSLIVQKFGGSSLATAEHIVKVARSIIQKKNQGFDLIVVVSAMGNSTDKLLKLANSVASKNNSRELDVLLSAGERISMALLSMALHDQGAQAISFTGSQAGLITENKHQNARILKITGERIKEALQEKKIVIIAGFQGVSLNKEITTLGRGGSDTTAVALAAVFKAERCEIYTDVAGVYSADPRVVPEARLLEKVCYSTMIEYALSGAGVLHPRSVSLAKKFNVPLYVIQCLKSKGTEIVKDDYLEKEKIIGISVDDEKMRIAVKLTRPTVGLAVMEGAQQSQLEVYDPFIYQSEFIFFANSHREEDWKLLLDDLSANLFVANYTIQSNCKPLSIVADFINTDGQLVNQALNALSDENIAVENFWVSGHKVTFCILEDQCKDALKVLHQLFFKEKLK